MPIGQLAKADLHLLSVFATVAEVGGFSAAQATLNVSASTISRQIANLETRLGIHLCERGRGGFRLTNRGATVYEAAKILFEALEDFRGTVDATRGQLTGQLSLAVVENWVTDVRSPLVETLAEFKTLAPEAQIEMHSVASNEIEHAILEARMSVGVGVFHQHRPGLNYEKICNDPVELYCGSQHPYFTQETSGTASPDMSSMDLVRRAYLSEEQVAPKTADLRSTASAHQVEGVAFMILSGTHVGYLPVQYAAQWIREGRMKSICPKKYRLITRIEAVTRRGAKLPLVAQTFLQMLKRNARKSGTARDR